MRQPLSHWTKWVMAGVLAGGATAAMAEGFLKVNETFTTIVVPGTRPGDTSATDINNAGQIVGLFAGKVSGFLYAGGTFTPIDVPGAITTAAFGINDARQIVGSFLVRSGVEVQT